MVGAPSPDARQHRVRLAGAVLSWARSYALASSAHSATTHFKSSEFIGLLTLFSSNLASAPRTWRRQVFSAKGYSGIITSRQGIYLDAIIYGRISDSNGNA
jgi:hypothetical protein